jgi:hypothetical protein
MPGRFAHRARVITPTARRRGSAERGAHGRSVAGTLDRLIVAPSSASIV